MKKLIAATLLAATAAFALPAAAETMVPTKTFDIYVDLPTGFTFVKMPGGWRFVGKVGAEEMASLPTTVHTALIETEDSEMRVAGRTPAPIVR